MGYMGRVKFLNFSDSSRSLLTLEERFIGAGQLSSPPLRFLPMNIDLIAQLQKAPLYFVPFLFALCCHEFAHAWVAKLRGDRTAETLGRLTLNPIPHVDLIGTIVLPLSALIFHPGFFLGWAKPVPVNPRNLARPRADMFWIAFAGPLSNIFLAIIGALVLGFMVRLGLVANTDQVTTGGILFEMLKIFILINVSLAVFNMIPMHPLDGGKVLARFLPENVNNFLEQNEQTTSFILLILMVTGSLTLLRPPIDFLQYYLFSLARMVA